VGEENTIKLMLEKSPSKLHDSAVES